MKLKTIVHRCAGPAGARIAGHAIVTLASCALTLLAIACTGKYIDPDNDDGRGLAKQMPLGQVVTDEIAAPEDAADWKVVQVPSPGFLTVTVFWDNASLESRVAMVDNFGKTLQEIRRDSRTPKDQMIIKCENASFYYLKVEASKGGSTYSVQSSFAAKGGVSSDGDDEPIPEFVAPIEAGAEGEEVQ